MTFLFVSNFFDIQILCFKNYFNRYVHLLEYFEIVKCAFTLNEKKTRSRVLECYINFINRDCVIKMTEMKAYTYNCGDIFCFRIISLRIRKMECMPVVFLLDCTIVKYETAVSVHFQEAKWFVPPQGRRKSTYVTIKNALILNSPEMRT